MTAELAGSRTFPEPGGAPPRVGRRFTIPLRRGRAFGIRTSQVVSTQLAAVLVLTGARYGVVALAVAAVTAPAMLVVTWLRVRGRWAFEWLGAALLYAGRRHTVESSPTALLDLVAPGSRIESAELAGDQGAIIVDAHGLTAILELGDPTGLLVEELPAIPAPVTLLPPPGTEHPPCRIQVLLTGVPGPALRAGNGTPATSYRQLTDGRLLGHSRSLLTVRVMHAEGWSEDDLRHSLTGLVRRIPRRLGPLTAHPLGEAAAVRVIAELAHDDGVTSVQESWATLRVGGLTQATFRLRRWPDLRVETSRRLVARLLALPAAATTVALTAGPYPGTGTGAAAVDLTVRLAAPDAATLAGAAQALHRILANERAQARRLDGEHLDGLLATLPLGGGATAEVPGRPTDHAAPVEAVDSLELPTGPAGLMIGNNRHGDPVVIRLFRPEQTRALLVGGVRCAQLIALRAMALGARVVVQTARPQVWDPFVRGSSVPGESIAVVPPGRAVEIPPGTALHPLLVLVDAGPVGADTRPGAGWQATLVVRDEFSPADVDVASRADLLILQPLRAEEASLVGAAVGLGDAARWLTRIRPDMVGLVNRRAVRWAALAYTSIETQLVGPAGRG